MGFEITGGVHVVDIIELCSIVGVFIGELCSTVTNLHFLVGEDLKLLASLSICSGGLGCTGAVTLRPCAAAAGVNVI